MIKADELGVEAKVFDELFSLFIWNQGVGFFSSEISTSALFDAYKLIKNKEQKDISKQETLKELKAKYGEKNPKVGTLAE